MQGQLSSTSRQDHPKGTGNLMIGGTADNGLGAALLYSGTRGDWREHSATKIDDVMLKSRYAPNEVHTFNSLLQYYEGEADMPGGLSRADYNANPFQSTRPYDKFWGRRQLANFGYQYQPDQQHKFDVQSFYTTPCAAAIWIRAKPDAVAARILGARRGTALQPELPLGRFGP